MEPKNEPYIKRLERQRDELLEALRSVVAYREAQEHFNNCAYKGDARKDYEAAKVRMDQSVSEALNSIGGKNV